MNNVEKQLSDAWLGIDVDESTLFNPMDFVMQDSDNEKLVERISWLMMRPEYFSFACKYLLNIELSPFQALILEEMWNRKFPMLIGSRGLGKSFILSVYSTLRALFMPRRKIIVVGAAFRQSKVLFEYMENIWKNAPILRDLCTQNSGPRRDIDRCVMYINDSTVTALPLGDGCLVGDTMITYDDCFDTISRDIFPDISEKFIKSRNRLVWGNGKLRITDEAYCNGTQKTKRITTRSGFSFEATRNHKMKVLRSGKIVWVRSDEILIGDNILIDRSYRWHNGDSDITNDQAYGLGLLVGDGSWCNKYKLGFASADQELVDGVNKLLRTYKDGDIQLKWNGEKDNYHYRCDGVNLVKWLKDEFGLVGNKTIEKEFPKSILMSSREKVSSFIRGLYDTDGHVSVNTKKGGTSITIGFTNTSERLVDQLQYILLHYGIISTKIKRDRNKNWNTVYELIITGLDCAKFNQEIGFGLERKQKILNIAVENKINHTTIYDTIPDIQSFMISVAKSNKIKRGNGNKITESVSASKIQKRKGITRSLVQKFLHTYRSFLSENDVNWIRSLSNDNIYYDVVTSITDSKNNTYDIHVPDGHEYCANGFFSHNTKIRGQRAHDIISDEFASIPRDIFENVVAGFAAVASSPIEKVKEKAKEKKAKELGLVIPTKKIEMGDKSNQIILSGTAYYDFNHFAEYWKRYHSIVESRGDENRLKDIFGGEVPKDFDWTEYSVIRIPVEKLPDGFMDSGQIGRAKATIHSGIYQMEYGAVFTTDSQGFFKRSLIENCTTSPQKPIKLNSGDICFEACLKGDPKKTYVYGVDPASEVDNFSIVVLEVNPDHRKVVHCWTTTRKQHKEKLKNNLVDEDDFYSYCAKKIRDLMRVFPCAEIALDSQGGGIAVMEALQDKDKIREGEIAIWPTIEEKEKDTDFHSGLHILKLCHFANAEWLATANHGLRKDFEDKVVLFPYFDSVSIGLSIESDKANNRVYDTLEDCVLEIEELKDELSMIVMTQTSTGRERWDTPEVKLGAGKKTRLRKDRYSALIMANMSARNLMNTKNDIEYGAIGGFAMVDRNSRFENSGKLFSGPSWFTDKMQDIY